MGGRIAINFVAVDAGGAGIRGLLPHGAGRAPHGHAAHPALGEGQADPLPFHQPLRRRRRGHRRFRFRDKMMYAFRENGQPLEWHFFPFGGHGFVRPGRRRLSRPRRPKLAWPMVVDFMERELQWAPEP